MDVKSEVVKMLPIVISAIESVEDRDLMTQFYLSYKALMFSEAWKYMDVEEDVEDVVYEALTRIIDKMDVFRELLLKQKIRYALTCVKNIAYMILKRRSTVVTVPFDDIDADLFEDDTQCVAESVEKKLLITYIHNIWHELDCDARMLLEQKYVLHWTDEELAANLGIKTQPERLLFSNLSNKISLLFCIIISLKS